MGTSGAKDLNLKSTTLFGSIYVSAIYKHVFGLRLEGTLGRVQSNDSLLAGVKKTAIAARIIQIVCERCIMVNFLIRK